MDGFWDTTPDERTNRRTDERTDGQGYLLSSPSRGSGDQKSNERILRKMRKTRFLAILGPFWAHLGPNGPNRNFSEHGL